MDSVYEKDYGAFKDFLESQNAEFNYELIRKAYEFAKDKPLKLLNGGHLLALLHKNGRKAHINIEEAKKIISENNSN
jgi:hypothetical protein